MLASMPSIRTAAVGLLSAAVVVLVSTRAEAKAEDTDAPVLLTVSTVAATLVDVGFLAGDVYFGSEGRWLPLSAAWTQLLLVGTSNVSLGIISLDHSTSGSWLAFGVGELMLGTWFLVHGFLSIMGAPDEVRAARAGRDDPEESSGHPRSHGEASLWSRLHATIAPQPDGAMALVGLRL